MLAMAPRAVNDMLLSATVATLVKAPVSGVAGSISSAFLPPTWLMYPLNQAGRSSMLRNFSVGQVSPLLASSPALVTRTARYS